MTELASPGSKWADIPLPLLHGMLRTIFAHRIGPKTPMCRDRAPAEFRIFGVPPWPPHGPFKGPTVWARPIYPVWALLGREG